MILLPAIGREISSTTGRVLGFTGIFQVLPAGALSLAPDHHLDQRDFRFE
jgi:hypothetical protein